MKIAVEGCCHGELDKIYATLRALEARERITIDLLICCGDFQAVRNEDDLECMSVPLKYRHMGTFYKYYSGEAEAPYPTIFIGGNHEASNYLWELYYGGWVAPNIFYLGHSGVVRVGDLRIGGLSGIFKSGDFRRGYTERPPYHGGDVKSAYHVREFDVFKLSQIREPLDVFLSHDWPRGIARHGDMQQLFRKKPFLQAEVEDNSLGNPPAEALLDRLKPTFSAHLHVKFAALVDFGGGRSTRFLALDKCLPRRDFLQVLDLPDKRPGPLAFDEEWLAITRAAHGYMPLTRGPAALPAFGAPLPAQEIAPHREFVARRLAVRGAAIPTEFVLTVGPHDPRQQRRGRMPQGVQRNPQTVALMELLEIEFKLDGGGGGGGAAAAAGGAAGGAAAGGGAPLSADNETIDLDEDAVVDDDAAPAFGDGEEIDLDDAL